MPKQNRAYKKGNPFKDARLFVIVAEGHREENYFQWFNAKNSRIQILLIDRTENESAPKLFIDRIQKAESEGKYSPDAQDHVWFICDVDRWRQQIEELRENCQQKPNWNIAVSNPCFEVWLHFHSGRIQTGKEISCHTLKQKLPKSATGAYNPEKYGPLIEKATEHAKNSDTSPDSFFPDKMQTKIYQLAESMLSVLGKNWQ